MQIATILHSVPSTTETFIVRQIKRLDSKVYLQAREKELRGQLSPEADRISFFGCGVHLWQVINRLMGWTYGTWSKRSLKILEKQLRADKIDVAIVPYGYVAIKALPVCRKLGIPMVIQFLGNDASAALKQPRYRKEIVEALEYANTAIVLYRGMMEPLVKLGANPGMFSILPVGVPFDQLEIAKDTDESSFLFSAVGWFTGKKSPLSTIRAFEICADTIDKSRLEFIGDGPLFKEASEYVSTSRHRDKIVLRGAQPHPQVAALLSRSNCFLQHSVVAANGDKEGWPTVIGEAAASALPVISTRHAGIPDQVVEGISGFLVDEHDIVAMAEYMIELAGNPALARQMGRAGRKHMEAYGDIEKITASIKMLLQEAAATRKN